MTRERPAPSGAGLPQHRITPDASRTLDAWAWGLADGSLRLWQLPDAVCTLYNVAYTQGRASRDDEIRVMRIDADRHWLLAMPDTTRRAYLLSRLDQAAELANRPDVDDVLDEAWRIYLANLDNIREPLRLPSTEHGRTAA
ncbi:hypothetical protein [Microbacterium sp. SD291]|uniref:hypothetical protein n=1 Tax=Microbacterium sp. SD291 TaxID=2782007 RepID=UPI001A9573DC|nr:hypothetical protein [Microbacterium sp. SD291]MBO0979901.1 hypothetical protein [Microbacterium sp. SD291]